VTAGRRVARAAVVAALAAACAACGRLRPAPAAPPVREADAAWPPALRAARSAMAAGDFRAAESTLAAFTRRHPESSAAADASYWWALARLDPGNRADRTAAIAVLDAYRATDPPRRHASEAAVLRNLVAQLDSLRMALAFERSAAAASANAAVAGRAGLVPRDSLRVRDEELARLRGEAAEARAELERVRRRLAAQGGRLRRP
jgi:outer membrane protein assembly factor BamD (BamD/ComL family)